MANIRRSLSNLLTSCFPCRSSDTDPVQQRGKTVQCPFKLRLRRRVGSTNIQTKCVHVSSETVFLSVLQFEGLLAHKTFDEPVINICLGFTNDELLKDRRVKYHSSRRSKWDEVFATPGVCKMAQNLDANEPIIDELPASLWLSCVEPILEALMSLNHMQHRRTNLSKKKPSATPELDPIESELQHGDFDREPWQDVIGPHMIFEVGMAQERILPTDEVRPSVWITEGRPDVQLQWFDLVTSRRDRRNARSRMTKILPCRGIHDEKSKAFPGLTYEDLPQSENVSDVNSESSDNGSYDLVHELFEE